MIKRNDIKEFQAQMLIGLPANRNGSAVTLMCSCGCGTGFERPQRLLNRSGMHYISLEHAGAHRPRLYFEETCGSFLGLVTEYLDELTRRGYKSVGTIRGRCVPLPCSLMSKASRTLGM